MDSSWQVDDGVLRSLKHVLLETKHPALGLETEYARAYAFWRQTWSDTFAEVDPNLRLHSDVFVAHREISAVFAGGDVVAIAMYDFRDLRLQAHRDLSHVRHYPSDVLNLLVADGHHHVMLGGQLAVHPKWRRERMGAFMSDLVASLAVRRLHASGYPLMMSCTRNDRGTQRLTYRHGAVPLKQGLLVHGIASDVVAFYRDRTRVPDASIAALAGRLWDETPGGVPGMAAADAHAVGTALPTQHSA